MLGIAFIIFALSYLYFLIRLDQQKAMIRKHHIEIEVLSAWTLGVENDVKELFQTLLPGKKDFDETEIQKGILRMIVEMDDKNGRDKSYEKL